MIFGCGVSRMAASVQSRFYSLQLRRYGVLSGRFIPRNSKQVGLAADLTIFNVGLFHASGWVNDALIPLTAARTLESGGHFADESEIPRMSSVREGSSHALVYFAP
jgi:hypothetical protein